MKIPSGYDIIGDIHGHADALTALLVKMGYHCDHGVWRHATRQAIFVCDLVDRGPQQLEAIQLVRSMVEAGTARAVMGNHELNAIAWHTPHPTIAGDYLRTRLGSKGAQNRHQHSAFLAAVEHDPALHADIIGWFKTLPLWLELPELCVVHAAWHTKAIDYLRPLLTATHQLPDSLFPAAVLEPTGAPVGELNIFTAVEALLKGIELPFPNGQSFTDADGIRRTKIRASWWVRDALTFRQHALLSRDAAEIGDAPATPIPEHLKVQLPGDRHIFFGHYWRTGKPEIIDGRLACVDYSAGKGHPLVAYRYSGEARLQSANFVTSR